MKELIEFLMSDNTVQTIIVDKIVAWAFKAEGVGGVKDARLELWLQADTAYAPRLYTRDDAIRLNDLLRAAFNLKPA